MIKLLADHLYSAVAPTAGQVMMSSKVALAYFHSGARAEAPEMTTSRVDPHYFIALQLGVRAMIELLVGQHGSPTPAAAKAMIM